MADWQTGLLQGFLGRKSETEKENIRQADLASQREHALFTALLGPEVNPEVQAMALSGLLEQTQARPRKGGLRGWVGEREASPIFQQLKSMITTPVPQEIEVPVEQQTLGSRQFGGPAVQPQLRESPGPEGAAMPAEAPVQGGGGPPVPLSWQAAPPQPYVLREKRTVMGPRKIYLTPQERYEQEATGKRMGEHAADRAEMTALNIPESEQADILKQKIAARHGRLSGYQHVNVEVPDGQGGWKQLPAVFAPSIGQYLDPETMQPLRGARVLTHTGSTSLGSEREAVSRELGYGPAAGASPAQLAHINTILLGRKNLLTQKDALTFANTYLPNATLDARLEFADALMKGTTIPGMLPGGGVSPAAPVVPTGPIGPPAPTGPPPAPATGRESVVSPTTGGTVSGPPVPTSLKDRVTSALPPGAGEQTKETGKPLSPAIKKELAHAQSVNDLIDQALKALDPYKDDNSLDTTLKFARSYRAGIFDPVNSAAAQLADLAGLQQSALQSVTGGGSRALQFFYARRQHTPRLPSYRQTSAGSILGGGLTNSLSGWMPGGDENMFDSPKAMYNKLLQAKEANSNIINELQATTTSETTPTAGPPAQETYQDAAGNWIIRR